MMKLNKKTRKAIAFVIEQTIYMAIVIASFAFILSISGIIENGYTAEAMVVFLMSCITLYATRGLYTIK